MTYAIVTFGCRVNTADSLAIEAALLREGATPASADVADLVIVNTCSVTATADQGARQLLRKIARHNPAARIVATGCYASRQPGDLASLPGVVAVVGNDSKDPQRLMPVLAKLAVPERASATEAPASEVDPLADGPCGSEPQPGFAGRTAWTLAVQTGCEERCSYCVIPRTRGAGRSVPIDEVLAHVRRAASLGYREVVITGVHLGSYGRDLAERTNLVALVDRLARFGEASDVRFRLSSIEPMDCSDELIDLAQGSSAIAPHFHVPLQHASDRVLAAMRRPYDLAHYAHVVDRIRERLPHAAIGADVMVGFPGEDQDDVDVLCEYLEGSPLTTLHVFPYSERPGTDAATFPRTIHGRDVRDRAQRVRQVGARLHERFAQSQAGQRYRALTLEDGTLALTGNYCKVRIPPGHTRNEWVLVQIDRVTPEFAGVVVE